MSCPVCLCVLVMPKKTPCGHYYCQNCIEYLLERHLGCGLCRSSWPKEMTSNIEVDKDFQEKVKKAFPEEFAEHEKELARIEAVKKNLVEIYFTVGNLHQEVKNPKQAKSDPNLKNTHKWTVFCQYRDAKDMSSKFIDKVVFELHPTFKNPIKTIKASDGKRFEYTTTGWGFFDIPISIYWKDGLVEGNRTDIQHTLCFEGDGKWQTITFKVDKNRLKKILGK